MKLFRLIWNGFITAFKRIGRFFKWLFSGEERIAVVSLFLTFGSLILTAVLFYINYSQIRDMKNQDRNDFYAINSSFLKIDIGDDKNYDNNIYKYKSDSTFYYFNVRIKNVSLQPCEIINVYCDYTSQLDNDGFYKSQNEYSFSDDSIKNYKIKNGFVTLLPNETYNSMHSTSVPKNLVELSKLKLFVYVLYRNSLGGYYHSYYDADIINELSYKIDSVTTLMPLRYSRRYFKTYKIEDFPNIR